MSNKNPKGRDLGYLFKIEKHLKGYCDCDCDCDFN